MKTGIVFGATGLIGKQVVKQLIDNKEYGKIKVFGRRSIGLTNPKIEEHIIDIGSIAHTEADLKGHVVFCCIGTTIKKAKNEANYRKVDYDMPVDIAHLAERNNVDSFVVVSSIGAKAGSSNYYLSIKGEMENTIKKYNFKRLKIVRPSFLLGKREEFRLKEMIGKGFALLLSPLMIGAFKRYKPIHAKKVAAAMIRLADDDSGQIIYESEEL